MGAALLIGAIVALGLTGALVAAVLGVRSVVGFALAAWAVAWAEVVAVSLLLSIPGWLRGATLGAAIVVCLAIALLVWLAAGRPRLLPPAPTLQLLRAALRDRVVAVTAAAAVAALGYMLIAALAIPEVDWDSHFYHLPRMALWAQEHGVGYIANVPDPRLNGMPVHAEIAGLATMLISGSDRYVWLVQFTSLLAAALAIVGVARRFGARPDAAVFAGLSFVLFPVVLLQAPTALNDLALVAPLTAATYFALGTTRADLALMALTLALAVGTKFTALLVLPLLVLVVFVFHPPRRWARLALAGASGVALGSFWYLLNLYETGSLDGGVAEVFVQTPDRVLGQTIKRAAAYGFGFLDLSGAEGRDRYLFPFAGAALALAAIAVGRRRGRRSTVPYAIGAVCVAATPWVVEAVYRAADRAYFEVALTIDRPWLTGNLNGDAPRTAASTLASWYGPAFLALALAAAPLVVRAVRSRALSAAAVPALAAPFLFVPILAYAVSHDPIRGRFFAFPVALAAATFAVVVNARAVAWTSAALLTLTAALSLVHYEMRPVGVSLLEPVESRALWGVERWEAQAAKARPEHDGPVAFRFFAERLPPDATVAVAAVRDTYLYPIFDARGRRTVLFVDSGGVPAEAGWLVVAPTRLAPDCPSWKPLLETPHGWIVLRRPGTAPCDVPAVRSAAAAKRERPGRDA